MIRKGIALIVILLFVWMSSISCISDTINKTTNMEIINNIEQSSFQVTITRPENGIYCFDKKILPFSVPLIVFGKITFEAEIEPMSEIERITIYINDLIFVVIEEPSPDYKLSYIWIGLPFSKTTFEISVYWINGSYDNDRIVIWRFFRYFL